MNSEELQEAYAPDPLTSPEAPFEQVKQFHVAFGLPVKDRASWPSDERLELRLELLEEELEEVVQAVHNRDLVNLAKELADLEYVVNGFAIEAGIDLPAVTTVVHESNMSKLGADGKPMYREDGKVLKGPNYMEAQLDDVLF